MKCIIVIRVILQVNMYQKTGVGESDFGRPKVIKMTASKNLEAIFFLGFYFLLARGKRLLVTKYYQF